MTDDTDFGEAILAIGLGILGGLAIGAILEALSKTKCPVCNHEIPHGESYCPYCYTALRWG